MTRYLYHLIVGILLLIVMSPSSSHSLEPLHEEELYDTSGQASPTVSIQLDKNHIVHYFNQNVVIFEPAGEISLSFESVYYGDDGNYVALISPEPIKYIIEFDKYPFFPEGIGIQVSDVFYTGSDGLPLPKYREFDPNAPTSLPPNSAYVRMKSAPVTISTINNRRDIVFALEGEKGEPDWEEARDDKNRLFSITQTYKMRTETGYIYIWAHD